MNRSATILFFLLMTGSALAQKGYFLIELNQKKPFDKYDFFCSKIIDNRDNPDLIGEVLVGTPEESRKAIFEEDLKFYLKRRLDKWLPKEQKENGLVFIFHEFNISEEPIPNKMTELGSCKIRLEIAREVDSVFYSLGIFESEVFKKGTDATLGHSKRILKALNQCLFAFSKTNWKQTEGKLIEKKLAIASLNYQVLPPKGLYLNFGQLERGEPLEGENFEFVPTDLSSDKYPKYILFEGGEKSKRRVLYASDGEGHIYIHASRYTIGNYFTKSIHYGKYIYFEDKSPDIAATVTLGLVGAALTNNPVGVLLFPETGKTQFLDDTLFWQLIKTHPEIVKAFKYSERKVTDQGDAIGQLNKKY